MLGFRLNHISKSAIGREQINSLRPRCVNSLHPGRCGSNVRNITFKLITPGSSLGTNYEIALRWMSQNFTNKKSTLFQVMGWCCQAASHYLKQSWFRSMSPCGVARPQWVKGIQHMNAKHNWTCRQNSGKNWNWKFNIIQNGRKYFTEIAAGIGTNILGIYCTRKCISETSCKNKM